MRTARKGRAPNGANAGCEAGKFDYTQFNPVSRQIKTGNRDEE